MVKSEAYFREVYRMTHFADALASAVEASDAIILSDYEIFLMACQIYHDGTIKYLRGDHPSIEQYKRARKTLKEARVIDSDSDYSRLWKVVSRGRDDADDVVCSADPYCYLSHLSAMQRYGVTLRRPDALYITRPTDDAVRGFIAARKQEDLGRLTFSQGVIEAPPLMQVHHPRKVRGRRLEVRKTKFPGVMRQVRGSKVRIASIGQVFLDMLEEPRTCGGMSHVLEVWDGHARTYLKEIIQRINEAGSGIAKVRAGYIISERLGVTSATVDEWVRFAQRGGSRKLDPDGEYAPCFSERWMISINAN